MTLERAIAALLAGLARLIAGLTVRWRLPPDSAVARIYFANHSSHLDGLLIWSVLPPAVRAKTRLVAARDYWEKNALRRYLAQRVFNTLLIERQPATEAAGKASRETLTILCAALQAGSSLILFPEGSRGDGETLLPFRPGLYHLARHCPEVDLIPVYLENLNRILPKGQILPVPILGSLTFGEPLPKVAGESKAAFLERAQAAVMRLRGRQS